MSQSKIQNHVKAPLQAFPVPDSRFDHVHIDIVCPLPPSKGYAYLFTCVDRYTRWSKAIPMVDATALSCASPFLSGWVSRFGVPTTITFDRGQQFESNLWKALMNLLGTTRHRTASYHPQANGMVDRFHRHLKSGLTAKLKDGNWVDELSAYFLVSERPSRKTCRAHLPSWSTEPPSVCRETSFVTQLLRILPRSYQDSLTFNAVSRHSMQSQEFVPTRWHGSHKTYLPPDLHSASHAYVRRDVYRPP